MKQLLAKILPVKIKHWIRSTLRWIIGYVDPENVAGTQEHINTLLDQRLYRLESMYLKNQKKLEERITQLESLYQNKYIITTSESSRKGESQRQKRESC